MVLKNQITSFRPVMIHLYSKCVFCIENLDGNVVPGSNLNQAHDFYSMT